MMVGAKVKTEKGPRKGTLFLASNAISKCV